MRTAGETPAAPGMAGLLISETDAKRLRRMLQWFERQERGGAPPAGGGTRPGFWVERWIGLIAAEGPNGEEDYTDERYWVQRARCANAAGGEETALTLEALDEADALAKCVTATNLAEIADGTHALAAGTPVAVLAAYDQQTPPVKHYWFVGGAGGEAGTVDNPYAMLPATFEEEDPQADEWSRLEPPEGTLGVTCRFVTRVAYVAGGDEVLYAFYRTDTNDSAGNLLYRSPETRIPVDIPTLCEAPP